MEITELTLGIPDDFQRTLIALMCADPDWLEVNRPFVKAEFFDRMEHRAVVGCILEFFDKHGTPPTFDVLDDVIRERLPNPDLLGASLREISCVQDIEITLSKVRHATDKLQVFAETQHLRECIRAGAIAIDGGDIASARRALASAEDVARINHSAVLSIFDETGMDERSDKESEVETMDKIPTLHRGLDKKLRGGFARKELHILMAPPYRGKSAGLVDLGGNALFCGAKVLHVTCEMSAKKTASRYDLKISGMTRDEIEANPTEFKARMLHFQSTFKGNLKVIEFPSRSATVADIEAQMKFLLRRQNFWPDVLVVDYLDELKRPNRDNEAYALGQVTSELRALNQKSNTVGLSATQTTRQGFSKQRLDMDDIGDSWEKVKIADSLIGMCQTKDEEDDNTMRLYMLKNRDNQRNSSPVLMRTIFERMTFKDITFEEGAAK